jgi:benzoyl-CoA reductase/2-hydroxyglutaryl-CoA dehydratase subunit BcrC/BadD/HgdB
LLQSFYKISAQEREKIMEIIKELPEVFEEFAEQRKNSFLAVKELKDKGVPVVGAYCTYFPQEIALAMGAATVGLCSTSDETISEKLMSIDQIQLWFCKDR